MKKSMNCLLFLLLMLISGQLFAQSPDGGMVSTTDGTTLVYTCPGDGVNDVLFLENNSVADGNYAYIVTNDMGIVLAIPPRNRVNLEGAGEGTCLIYGVSYFGKITVRPGDNLNGLTSYASGPSDLSENNITAIRDVPEGGTISTPDGETVVFTCPGDGIDDVVTVVNSDSSNSKYAYIVTDSEGTVLGIPPGNQVNVEGAGPGNCLIYGVAFTGNLTVQPGDDINTLTSFSDDCSSLSDNFITTMRSVPDGGSVSTTDGETVVNTCPGDGIDDIVTVTNSGASNSNYAYIVTNAEGIILGIPPNNQVNVEGAGPGNCLIYGVAFTGNLTVQPGDDINTLTSFSDDCSSLSDNFITTVRSVPDGGSVTTTDGETVVNTCPGDGIDDIVTVINSGTSDANYAYIVTNAEGIVLGIPPGNQVNVEGAGPGNCLIYGVAFTGNLTVQPGDDINMLTSFSDECASLSDNFITTVRSVPDAGSVTTTDGETVVNTCPGDGIDDIVTVINSGTSDANYAYIVTNAEGIVLGIPPGNQVNVEGAGPGNCLIYGVAFTGNLTVQPGDDINTLTSFSDECASLSDNFITTVRSVPDAGSVTTTDGETVVNTCPGDGIDDIVTVINSGTSDANYAYIVTNAEGIVLGIPPGNQVNVEGAGPGNCLIYGVAFTGNLTVQPGDDINTLTSFSDECASLSDNFITTVRSEDNCDNKPSIKLKARVKGRKVTLHWETTNVNAEQFIALRKDAHGKIIIAGQADGNKSSLVDIVNGKGDRFWFWLLALVEKPEGGKTFIVSNMVDVRIRRGRRHEKQTDIIEEVTDVLAFSTLLSQEGSSRLYPNPAQTEINLATKDFEQTKSYKVLNTFGKVVMKGKIGKDYPKLNIDQLSSGSYLMMLENNDGLVETMRFIKE